MAEIALESLREQKHLRRSWLLSVLLHPREAFGQITARSESLWLLPLVVISLAALVNVYVVGHIRQTTAALGEVQIPPELQYFTPEQQAQSVQQGMPPSSVAVSTPTWLLGFALLFAVLIGLLSGIYPALQAATLIPVKALKYE
jgi:ABC-type antimicrobial peptide transport system permease subunit